jgi:exosortase/archaeosortase family protein
VVRVVGITLCMIPFPDHFDFFHDYLFKTLFYFFIFIMWVVWVEKFLHKKEKIKK